MPKSSWSICVSGTIRVPIKRFCLPWFPRFDFFFFFFNANLSARKFYSTLRNWPIPPPGKRTPSKASRYRRRLFPFSFSLSPRKRKERETGLVVPRFHSSLQLNGYSRGGLPCRERRVYPFNRKNRVRGSVTISRFSKYIAVIPNYTGEIIRKEKWKQ